MAYDYYDPGVNKTSLQQQNEVTDSQLRRIEEPYVGRNWMGEEYTKHAQAMRERYPLLTQLLLHGTPETNANLTGIEGTNKWARLADAYNAQLRYIGNDYHGAVGIGSTMGQSKWETVPQLSTQDQSQMDELRRAQGDLRTSQISMEEDYQKKYRDAKMEEMKKVSDQSYKGQFAKTDEAIRQTAELFDMWKAKDYATYIKRMEQLGIAHEKADALMQAMLGPNGMVRMQLMAQSLNQTGMSADQVFEAAAASDSITKALKTTPPPDRVAIAKELGKMKGYMLIGQFDGLLQAATDMGGEAAELVPVVRDMIRTAAKAGTAVLSGVDSLAGLLGTIIKIVDPTKW